MRAMKNLLMPVSILAISGVMLYDHLPARMATAPEPAVNGVTLGRAYASVLVKSYADAWVAAARSLEAGKSVAEAQKALQDSWKDARSIAFKEDVVPGFAVILPEGTEPTNAAKRKQVAELWRSFAKGLKAGR